MKHAKMRYQVQIWAAYEQSLRNRGSLTVWPGLVDGKLSHWGAPKPRRSKPGCQPQDSEHAIETALTLGIVLRL